MSALRLGRNPDGTREIRVLEPQVAKRQGWGGSALGHFSGTTLTTPPRQKPKTERRLEQGREASKRYRERMRTQ